MKNSQIVHELVENILSKEGHQALEAWSEVIKATDGNVPLLVDIHSRVGPHLTTQIQKTFSNRGGK